MTGNKTLVDIKNLTIEYEVKSKKIRAVNQVNMKIYENECVALVGESGSGKSTIAFSILRVLPPQARVINGKIIYKNIDLLTLSEDEMTKIRGKEISIIFQDPASYLNPVYRVGEQLTETIILHNPDLNKNEAYEKAIDLLRKVRIPEPERVFRMYPFQLSGGMAQRVLIAMALSSNPRLLIADEPTTGLDVTVQAQILKLLKSLKNTLNLSILLITHDLGTVAYMADRIYVMYLGEVMEEDKAHSLFSQPIHPYTRMLIAASKKIYGIGDTTIKDKAEAVDLNKLKVEVPVGNLNNACKFFDRCLYSINKCKAKPPYFQINEFKSVRCWLYEK